MTDFWSRRRAAVEAEEHARLVAQKADAQAQTEAELEARSDEDLLAENNLPQPEALDSPEAVRDFLQHALPQRLRTRALRRLWRLNPVLANVDGLVDYGEDFTDSATVVENLQTAYQVGKGMLKHVEEMARQAAEAAEAEERAAEAEERGAGPDEDSPTVTPEAEVFAAADPAPTPYEPPAYDTEGESDAPRPPARMRFQFEA